MYIKIAKDGSFFMKGALRDKDQVQVYWYVEDGVEGFRVAAPNIGGYGPVDVLVKEDESGIICQFSGPGYFTRATTTGGEWSIRRTGESFKNKLIATTLKNMAERLSLQSRLTALASVR